MKAVIVSGGAAPSDNLLKEELKSSQILICADSGGNCLYKNKIVPEYLLGDFDSIDAKSLDFFRNTDCKIEKYPVNKNFTDTEIAFNKAVELKADEIVFLGSTGNRIDHLFGNIGMLKKCLNHNIKGYIKDDNNSIEIINKSTTIDGHKGETFSLYAYCDSVKGLSIIGAKYKLDEYDLILGDSRTVSNEFLDNEVNIVFKSGIVLLFRSRD